MENRGDVKIGDSIATIRIGENYRDCRVTSSEGLVQILRIYDTAKIIQGKN